MNIYILTEEKPKISVVIELLTIYKNDFYSEVVFFGKPQIIPLFMNSDTFLFKYEFVGAKMPNIDHVYLLIVSGFSSFIDYLFFISENPPSPLSTVEPLFAVEETKTSDDESRNTDVYQRCSKFVFIKPFYPKTKLYMLYNDELELRENKRPSDTSIFGTNLLLTIGVTIVGKPVEKWFSKFKNIDEIIAYKKSMRLPPKSNTPILIQKYQDRIEISGRLDKPNNIGKISHDPNIGALSAICATIRHLGWEKPIIIKGHRITQEYLTKTNGKNKFLYICNLLKISLLGLVMPEERAFPDRYWHYESESEKIASILLHIASECCDFKEIYQNHAGCERGYFKTENGELLTLPKKTRAGINLLIPDLIIRDPKTNIVLLIEGKKLSTIKNGLKEIEDYDDIENLYIKKYFPESLVKRYLTIFGGTLKSLPDKKVIFYLKNNGEIIVNENEKLIRDILAYIVFLNTKIY